MNQYLSWSNDKSISNGGISYGHSLQAFRGVDQQRLPDHALALRAEMLVETFDAFDQRPRQVVQHLAFRGQDQARARALQQMCAEFLFQRRQLQADRGRRQEQRLGGARNRSELDRVAERTQLLEPVALVVEAGGLRRAAALRQGLAADAPFAGHNGMFHFH